MQMILREGATPARQEYAVESTAEAYLALLAARGIEYLYVNAGTDFAPIVEAYARQQSSELRFPRYVVCPHENLALGMAHGYYLATGRPQAVMVHVSVGTANALCALMNAARDNSPVLFTAGRSPLFETGRRGARSMGIHWAQEMFDQAGMLREMVKWDYELRDGAQLAEVVDRALSVAMAPPRGPVYLSLPREVLAQPMARFKPPAASPAVPTDPAPDPDAVERLLTMIAGARYPVFVVNELGREPANVSLLAEVAERLGVGVVEVSKALFMSLPASHPLHLGCDVAPALAEADLLVVFSTEAPWIPLHASPRPGARVVEIGVDPLFSRIPIRSFSAELAITASGASTLAALRARLDGRSAAVPPERRAGLGVLRRAARDKRAARIGEAHAGPRITKALLNAALDELRPRESIVVNEYWTDRSIVDFEHPGTYFSHSMAGGLGWGLPAALGIQQALRDRVVVATLGDGAYVFANPPACHIAAAAERLPVLTIVCNNGQWEAVKRATLQVYADGHAARERVVPMSSLEPVPAYERYVEASGGLGLRVEHPEDLAPTLKRAFEAVSRERRQTVVNVLCD